MNSEAKNSPYYPIVEIAHIDNAMSVYRHDVVKVSDFYNGDLEGNYLSFVRSS